MRTKHKFLLATLGVLFTSTLLTSCFLFRKVPPSVKTGVGYYVEILAIDPKLGKEPLFTLSVDAVEDDAKMNYQYPDATKPKGWASGFGATSVKIPGNKKVWATALIDVDKPLYEKYPAEGFFKLTNNSTETQKAIVIVSGGAPEKELPRWNETVGTVAVEQVEKINQELQKIATIQNGNPTPENAQKMLEAWEALHKLNTKLTVTLAPGETYAIPWQHK